MDNAAAPPNKRNSGGAVTDSRADDPADPRREELAAPADPTDRNGSAESQDDRHGSASAENGKGRFQRRPRWRSSSPPQAPTESVIPVEDAVPPGSLTTGTAPQPVGTPAPTTHAPIPALLPPIRTAPHGDERPIVRKVLRPPDPAHVVPAPVVTPVGRGPSPGEPVTGDPAGAQPTVATPVVLFDDPLPTTEAPAVRRVARPAVTFKRRSTRPRVRRVTRVVRHIDTWSVFKVALVFNAFLYAVMLTAGVLLWHVAIATGTVDNIERFFEGFGWESFDFKGGEIYHNAWVAGLFVAVGLTGLAVLLATLFNLITDLVGGVRVSVLEEEVLARRDRTAKMVVEDDPEADAPYDQARSG